MYETIKTYYQSSTFQIIPDQLEHYTNLMSQLGFKVETSREIPGVFFDESGNNYTDVEAIEVFLTKFSWKVFDLEDEPNIKAKPLSQKVPVAEFQDKKTADLLANVLNEKRKELYKKFPIMKFEAGNLHDSESQLLTSVKDVDLPKSPSAQDWGNFFDKLGKSKIKLSKTNRSTVNALAQEKANRREELYKDLEKSLGDNPLIKLLYGDCMEGFFNILIDTSLNNSIDEDEIKDISKTLEMALNDESLIKSKCDDVFKSLESLFTSLAESKISAEDVNREFLKVFDTENTTPEKDETSSQRKFKYDSFSESCDPKTENLQGRELIDYLLFKQENLGKTGFRQYTKGLRLNWQQIFDCWSYAHGEIEDAKLKFTVRNTGSFVEIYQLDSDNKVVNEYKHWEDFYHEWENSPDLDTKFVVIT